MEHPDFVKITQQVVATIPARGGNVSYTIIIEPHVVELVQSLFRNGSGVRVDAIKFVRRHYDLALIDAKYLCDALEEIDTQRRTAVGY